MGILDAFLDLVGGGQLQPTALEVATRAGVALRTVYHHFDDVEALRHTALILQLERHGDVLRALDPDATLDERILKIARQLRRLFEAITAIRLATLPDVMLSREMSGGLDPSRALRRAHLARTFASELARCDGGATAALDSLDTVTSWLAWHHLRAELGRSPSAAERVVSRTLHGLLAPVDPAVRR
ncbi:MAG: TetR/AcrR family transcriptional regulator [Acidimicrobiales bacterium]